MEEFYIHINKKLYYITVMIVILLMSMGLFIENPLLGRGGVGFFLHATFVIILSFCLLIYPKYKTHLLRVIIMIISVFYFYTIFFTYPDTWTNFIFLCLIPAIAILFYDQRLFHFTLIFNCLAIFLSFGYILLFAKGDHFAYIHQDLSGTIINFIGCQAVMYFIFFLSYGRMKKQQLYFEQMKQAERLKTTGQLAAAVAHEIRNPLTVVKGFLQLYEDSDSNTDLKQHYPLLIEELNTAEEIISQFLTIAKPNKLKETETVNVKNALQGVTDLLHSYGLLHDNKIELKMGEDCYIAANNMEFKQLLINIIKNAIEASVIGDPVEVTAGKRKDLVEIKVTDFGTGMTQEEIECLGTPFYSLKSKGTGLGMMICYNIVANYKGTIHFKSKKGEGTTVIIKFPAINC